MTSPLFSPKQSPLLIKSTTSLAVSEHPSPFFPSGVRQDQVLSLKQGRAEPEAGGFSHACQVKELPASTRVRGRRACQMQDQQGLGSGWWWF